MKTQLLNLQNGMRSSDATFVLLKSKMKGLAILLSIMLLMTFSMKSFAQTQAVLWNGISNTAYSSAASIIVGNVSATNFVVSPNWLNSAPGARNNSNTYNYMSPFTSTNPVFVNNTYWAEIAKGTGVGANYSSSNYVEFKVTPTSGSSFNAKLLQFSALLQGGSVTDTTGKMAVYYSIDNDATSFANPTNMGTATLGSRPVTKTSSSTISSPISLVPSSIPTGKLGDGSEDISFAPNLTVTSGQTLTVRIYAWSATKADKQLAIRNVVISNTTQWPLHSLSATTSASNISTTGATLGGSIVANGGNAVTESGVLVTTNSGWVLPSYGLSGVIKVATSPVVTSGAFTSAVTGLTASTIYYARSYAVTATGLSYGALTSFTTPSTTATVVPTLSATATSVSNITGTSATTGGSISTNGGEITESGVLYSTSAKLTTDLIIGNVGSGVLKTSENVVFGAYVSNLTGLVAGTTYYVRAYATNSSGTGYGSIVPFTTPLLTTDNISSVTETTGTTGGVILTPNGVVDAITASGVVVSSTATVPALATVGALITTENATTGSFVSNLTGLTGATTYYVRSYATAGATTYYGEVKQFRTSNSATLTVPVLAATPAVGTITSTAGTVTDVTITSNGGAPITEKGIVWGTTTAPVVGGYNQTVSTTPGLVFSGSVRGLPGFTYYVRSYATNSVGTGYGDEVSFTTPETAPTIATTAATNISSVAATTGGTISIAGGNITASGVLYSTTLSTTANLIVGSAASVTTDGLTGNTVGSFVSNLTGLTPSTLYYVRAYATNGVNTSYGSVVSFTTPTAPQAVLWNGISNTAYSSAASIIVGNVSATNFVVSPNWLNSAPGARNNSNTYNYMSPFTSTNPVFVNNTYWAEIAKGTGVGANYSSSNYVEFKVTPTSGSSFNAKLLQFSALLQGGSVTDTTGKMAVYYSIDNDATSFANPTNMGTATLGSRPVTKTSSSTISSPISLVPSSIPTGKLGDGSEDISFAPNLTVTSGQTLTVRIYAWSATKADKQLAIRNVVISNTTQWPLHSLSATTSASNISTTGATLGGSIVANGGNAVTESGVLVTTNSGWVLPSYGLSGVIKVATSPVVTSGAFTSAVTGLTASTIYYARSYAVTATGLSYGALTSFTTPSTTATVVPTLSATATSVSNITGTSATTGGSISTNGGEITESGVLYSTSAKLTTDLIIGNVGSGVLKTSENVVFGAYVSNLTGLVAGTTYYVRAYATNSSGTGYGSIVPFTTPLLTTDNISSVTETTGTTGGVILTPNGVVDAITASGVVVSSTATVPALATVGALITTENATTGSFVSNLTGLTGATTYYVRSYATAGATTYYGEVKQFRTSNSATLTVPVLAATPAVGTITSTAGTVTDVTITSNGGAPITEKGIVWGTTTAPVVGGYNQTVSTTPGLVFSGSVRGLPGFTYYVRSYATNSVGTGYGDEVSFTTPETAPTIATTAATNISSVAATTGGTISIAGGNITASGVLYSTTLSTTANLIVGSAASVTTDGLTGNTVGSFVSNLTGLTPSTLYYVRAYATNGVNTSYGSIVNFTTTAETLPISLVSFSAKASESGVALKWSTSSEINVKGFEVERRTANSDFVIISNLITPGNKNYTFLDRNVQNEIYYYRLKTTDNDGSYEYSNVTSVEFNMSNSVSVKAYPNPTTDKINVVHQAATAGNTISILGLNGVTYNSTVVKIGDTQTTLDVSALTPGIYIVVINQNNKRSTIKFVKN